MLWAVAAASPATTTMAGTMLMAKAPRTILIRYSAPAILASWRGGVPPIESINDLLQLVLAAGEIAFDVSPRVARWRVRPCATGATVLPAPEPTLARLI